MRSSDIVIVPSHIEACGNVTIEALSLGKIVISRRTGIASQIDSDNLYLVNEIDKISTILQKGISGNFPFVLLLSGLLCEFLIFLYYRYRTMVFISIVL